MILGRFADLSPIVQAFVAGCFTWLVTSLGASAVVFFSAINKKILDGMLGFAAGVMIAASFWSLLAPAIEMTQDSGLPPWFPAAVGFLLGGVFLWGLDKMLPHLHMGLPIEATHGLPTHWHKSTLLVLAITLHNIPEGIAVGIAFGAVAAGLPAATLASAVALTIGIGIQNFPEGTAVSVPLRREGMSRLRSLWYGQLSGVVEPVAAVIGATAVLSVKALLPYALSFAAGAMIFVVVEQLVPESHHKSGSDIATAGAMLGFALMMVLDVTFG